MTVFRIVLMVLAIINLLIAGFGALFSQFADGGDFYSRLILTVLHPISAVSVIALVLTLRLPVGIVIALTAIFVVNIAADSTLSVLIASGNMKGDWPLPLLFSVVPAIAIIYTVLRLRTLQQPPDDADQPNET